MKPLTLFAAVPLALFMLGSGAAHASKTVDEAGALACFTDKWDEKELEKGHKLVDAVFRCVSVPDDAAAPKNTEDCAVKYEYKPDDSWKGTGTCTLTFKNGDKVTDEVEEGSHLKEYTYKRTGGTGKYQGVSGGGTYTFEILSDTLGGGRYKGNMVLP